MSMKMGVQNPNELIPAIKKRLAETKEKDPSKYAALVSPKALVI